MRHRASRPFLDFWHRLPRTAARRPARVGGVLIGVLALGTGAYAVVGSVTEGGPTTPESDAPVAAPSRTDSTASAAPRPEATERSTPTPSRGTPPGPTSTPSSAPPSPSPARPSATGSPDELLPPETRSAAPDPRGVASQAPTSPETDDRDLRAPITRLLPEFPAPGEAVLTFSSGERATYECSLDEEAYTPCGSPVAYEDLDPGWHTFAVRATDTAGNVDPSPARTSWHTTGFGPGAAGEE